MSKYGKKGNPRKVAVVKNEELIGRALRGCLKTMKEIGIVPLAKNGNERGVLHWMGIPKLSTQAQRKGQKGRGER